MKGIDKSYLLNRRCQVVSLANTVETREPTVDLKSEPSFNGVPEVIDNPGDEAMDVGTGPSEKIKYILFLR